MVHNDAVSGPEIRTVRALARGLELLDLFMDGQVLTQTELSARTGLPMPTVHRMVGTLVQSGYLESVQGTDRALRIGPAVRRLASPSAEDGPQEIVRRTIVELSESTRETVHLATLVGTSVVYLDGVAGTKLLTPKVAIGTRLPAHCTALGKALWRSCATRTPST